MSLELDHDGATAPPRDNGELVFDAPWQSRAFGLAAALHESGRVDWSDFQAALITAVAAADGAGDSTAEPEVYWRCWLHALIDVLGACGVVEAGELDQRCLDLADRSPGHDH